MSGHLYFYFIQFEAIHRPPPLEFSVTLSVEHFTLPHIFHLTRLSEIDFQLNILGAHSLLIGHLQWSHQFQSHFF